MPGARAGDHVEASAAGVPILEPGHLRQESVGDRDASHPLVGPTPSTSPPCSASATAALPVPHPISRTVRRPPASRLPRGRPGSRAGSGRTRRPSHRRTAPDRADRTPGQRHAGILHLSAQQGRSPAERSADREQGRRPNGGVKSRSRSCRLSSRCSCCRSSRSDAGCRVDPRPSRSRCRPTARIPTALSEVRDELTGAHHLMQPAIRREARDPPHARDTRGHGASAHAPQRARLLRPRNRLLRGSCISAAALIAGSKGRSRKTAIGLGCAHEQEAAMGRLIRASRSPSLPAPGRTRSDRRGRARPPSSARQRDPRRQAALAARVRRAALRSARLLLARPATGAATILRADGRSTGRVTDGPTAACRARFWSAS